jgi:formyltetrahydrofolate synthetase
MSRGPCSFKQSDITKAVKAVVAAGVQVERVEVDKAGKIIIVTAIQPMELGENASRNEWDGP